MCKPTSTRLAASRTSRHRHHCCCRRRQSGSRPHFPSSRPRVLALGAIQATTSYLVGRWPSKIPETNKKEKKKKLGVPRQGRQRHAMEFSKARNSGGRRLATAGALQTYICPSSHLVALHLSIVLWCTWPDEDDTLAHQPAAAAVTAPESVASPLSPNCTHPRLLTVSAGP